MGDPSRFYPHLAMAGLPPSTSNTLSSNTYKKTRQGYNAKNHENHNSNTHQHHHQNHERGLGLGFRSEKAVPPEDDLLERDDVPCNRVGLPYQDPYEYLQTQFRLLREHLLSPYRKAISQYREDEYMNPYKSPSTDIRVYSSVWLVDIRPGRDGVEFCVKFSCSSSSSIDWEESQNLMYNSLLCISNDDFKTFSFAVVSTREESELEMNMVAIRPVEDRPLKLYKENEYTMFESSSTYLEAYIHALKVLQKPDMERLVFRDQLVSLQTQVSEINAHFDWKKVCKFDLKFDASQEEAIQHGITKNFAIIQGPPGTGKTFTGLQIVRALLKSQHRGPILIVCYTNRALDQFLEGILKFENSLVRMGSRSKSLVISEYLYKEMVQKMKQYGHFGDVPREERKHQKYVFNEKHKTNREKKGLAKLIDEKCKGTMPRDELFSLSERYKSVCKAAQTAKMSVQALHLKKFSVMGMTASFAARNDELLRKLGANIMVVEEAAEVTEAQILGCLNPCINHLILIGDHQQLRPLIATTSSVSRDYSFDVSLFERMISNGVEYKSLQVQRRMRPQISELVSCFYPHLINASSVEKYPSVRGMSDSVLFIDHDHPEQSCTDVMSKCNPTEAELVVDLCQYLTDCCEYKPTDITILSMYRTQAEDIERKIRAKYGSGSKPKPKGRQYGRYNSAAIAAARISDEDAVPKVRSVDEFQGEECNIILLSLVRNHRNNGGIGFVGNANRVCVALSRARLGLYMFGCSRLLSHNSQLWDNIIVSLQTKGCLRNACTPTSPSEPFSCKVCGVSNNLQNHPQISDSW